MATKRYQLTGSWQRVSNGAALIEIPVKCRYCRIHTGISAPAEDTLDFHNIAGSEARTFSYGGVHAIYVKSPENQDEANSFVIVTGDDLP